MPLAGIVMVGMVVAVAGGSCQADDNALMQMNQGRRSTPPPTPAACEIKPLPCGDPNFANFPLQVINREGPKRATFNVLNLNDGSYTDICDVPGAKLNGCGINPIDNAIYCVTADGNAQFVRVQCDFPPNYDPANGPIPGSLCFFGQTDGNFAASFDPFSGDYIYKTNGGEIDRIQYADITMYTGYASATDANNAGPSQVSPDNLVTNNPLNQLADFDIAKFAAGTLFMGMEQLFLVGCRDNKVFLQSLTNTANFAVVTMTDYGTSPSGASGASWLFRGNTTTPDVYCAYNDGVNGVIQVNVTQIFNDGTTDRIPTGFVSPSEETNSNDGLNCEKATSPFGPPRTVTTTTSTSTTTTTTTTKSTTTTTTTESTTTTTTTESTTTTTTTESTTTTTTTESTTTTTTTESTTTTTTTESTRSLPTRPPPTTSTTESTTTTESTSTMETTETAPDPGSSTTTKATTTSTDKPTTTSTDEPTTSKKPYSQYGQHRRHRRFRRFLPFRRHGRHDNYDQHGYRYS